MTVQLVLNGRRQSIDVVPQMPMLWVLRDVLGLTGTKFGCGIGQCGACTVHVDGVAVRSCQTAAPTVAGRSVTTIEGLSTDGGHVVQRAWIDEDVPQCGYCQSGQIMTAVALLAKNAAPTDDDIDTAMRGPRASCTHRSSTARCSAAR